MEWLYDAICSVDTALAVSSGPFPGERDKTPVADLWLLQLCFGWCFGSCFVYPCRSRQK